MLRTNSISSSSHNMLLDTHLSILAQVDLERRRITLKPQRVHRKEYILPIQRLAFLARTAFRRFRRDEADELGRAFLHALLGVFRHLRSGRETLLHHSEDVRDG
jgi:hypothetical protein